MSVEIERKFIVADPDWAVGAEVIDVDDIVQAYLCSERERSVRVRIRAKRATLTIKGETQAFSRPEFEYAIPLEDARQLLQLCGDLRLEKRRHRVRHGGRTWEVDVFDGRNAGLIIAEIELGSSDEDFERPTWIGREVSDEPAFLNANLVRRPYADWQR
ncbi:MAG: CYTH domain-containing protein [Burkholderiaceae bacterium]